MALSGNRYRVFSLPSFSSFCVHLRQLSSTRIPRRLISRLRSLSSCVRRNRSPYAFLVSSSRLPLSPVVSALAFVEHDIKLDSKEKKKVLDRRTGPICAAMAQCKVVDLAVLAYSDSGLSGASQPQSLLRQVESISLRITGLGLAAVPQHLAIPSVIIA